jgi:hypothetical protein
MATSLLKGTGKILQKTSKSLILFLNIGFLHGRSQSGQGFALQKSADSRHETVSVDYFLEKQSSRIL